MLEQGNNIPADCRLIEAFDVRVNNATITGESLSKAATAEPSEKEELIHAENILLAGTSMVSGQAKAVVFATGMHTEFGKIAHLTQTGREAVSPLRSRVAHLSRFIGILAIVIGLSFFAISRIDRRSVLGRLHLRHRHHRRDGAGRAAADADPVAGARHSTHGETKRLIRYLPSVETLGSTTVICTDKTGTLTQNRMTVRRVSLGAALDFARAAQSNRMPADDVSAVLSDRLAVPRPAREASTRASGAAWRSDGNRAGRNGAAFPLRASGLQEARRNSVRRRSHAAIDGACDAGRPHAVLQGRARDGHAALQPDPRRRRGTPVRFPAAGQSSCKRRKPWPGRACESSRCHTGRSSDDWQRARVEEDLIFAGLAGLEDPPRPEVPEALRKCREAGIRVIMVTGDHPFTAMAIGREIGLIRSDDPMVITGDELRALTDTQLRLALDAPEIIFARVGADQKRRIVEALKEKEHVVAVTGDGVNDAPALKSAHIGIAMGITGTDVAKEAADMVLLDDNFASIVNAIEEGRAVFSNIRKFLTYILAHNVPELIPYLASPCSAIPLALTPIQILSIDMGTDSLTALGLGVEKPDPRMMQRPPRSQHERLFDWPLALRAYVFLGAIEAAIAMAAFFFVLHRAGWRYGQPLDAHDPLYHASHDRLLQRDRRAANRERVSVPKRHAFDFSSGLLGNPLIWGGVIVEIALVVLIGYTSIGNSIFGTAPIGVKAWLFILPFAAVMLVAEELRKSIVRGWWRTNAAQRDS